MESLAPEFEKIGWKIVARWVFGGEEGLTRTDIALLDLEDVDKADAIILFTEPYGSPQTGGGRFVEFGYALGHGKTCIIVGEYENVFAHHPAVKVYPTLGDLLRDRSTQP
jgi:nucleoside 2-deoxyribosyltransferase